jgi:hypothetical protein
MSVALQIRDVPEDVRDVLAERAAQDGKSVQAYLLDMVTREARIQRNASMFERSLGSLVAIPADLSPEGIIREGRESQSRVSEHTTDDPGRTA